MKKPTASRSADARTYSASLVTRPVVPDEEDAREVEPVVCTLCAGPARLCGGARFCTGGPTSSAEKRWLVAIGAVYAGLLLTRTPAALWGGVLLRLARQVARRRLPTTVARLAIDYADPECAISPVQAANLALAYLQRGDVASLHGLQALREAQAPWLAIVCTLGRRAALTTPLEGNRYALVAVLCDPCAARVRAGASIARLVAHVDTYDAAIRCPQCGAVATHPLGAMDIGEPHPVSRCVAGAARRCMAHRGDELDATGLCSEGRAIFDQSVAEIAGKEGSPTGRDRDLVDALQRAQRWRPVLPPELLPVFAALAKADPEAARALAHLNGAPLDTEAADPDLVEKLTPRPGLSGVLAAVEAAVEHSFRTLMHGIAGGARPRRRGAVQKASKASHG